jgi:DNA-binding transcriptional MocR family regulator
MNIRVLRAAGDDRRLHGRAALLWCLLVPPSHSHGVPAYRQIALAQQRSIDEGEFGVGGQLPTEPLPTAEFGVNRLTVDRRPRAGRQRYCQARQRGVRRAAVHSGRDRRRRGLAKGRHGQRPHRVQRAHQDAVRARGGRRRGQDREAACIWLLPTADIQRVDTVIGLPSARRIRLNLLTEIRGWLGMMAIGPCQLAKDS